MPDSPLKQLDIGQWAWEFLRRNPAYQADYREFIAIWQALEADYGAPPKRDFARWKLDPRATRPARDPSQSTGASCTADDVDKQLIECWMGSKWGFYQFPNDPQIPACELQAPVNWRPPPGLRFEREAVQATEVRLTFDLALPLPAQLEAARLWLVSRQSALRRHGQAAPRTLTSQAGYWEKLLAALDTGSGDLLDEAEEMARRGYREILRLGAGPR